MSEEKRFKVLLDRTEREEIERSVPDFEFSVPWGFVAGSERRAMKTHSQSLAVLNRRGGLGTREMIYMVLDESVKMTSFGKLSEVQGAKLLKKLVEGYEAGLVVEALKKLSGGGYTLINDEARKILKKMIDADCEVCSGKREEPCEDCENSALSKLLTKKE